MAGEAHSIVDDRTPFAYLAIACPSLMAGLEGRLPQLPLLERARYGWMLSRLVRTARSPWEAQLDELHDQSDARYRTDLRLIERLRRRHEFCGLETEGLLDLVAALREGADPYKAEEREAYRFALDRLVRFLGILIRAEAGGLRVILGGKAPKSRTS